MPRKRQLERPLQSREVKQIKIPTKRDLFYMLPYEILALILGEQGIPSWMRSFSRECRQIINELHQHLMIHVNPAFAYSSSLFEADREWLLNVFSIDSVKVILTNEKPNNILRFLTSVLAKFPDFKCGCTFPKSLSHIDVQNFLNKLSERPVRNNVVYLDFRETEFSGPWPRLLNVDFPNPNCEFLYSITIPE